MRLTAAVLVVVVSGCGASGLGVSVSGKASLDDRPIQDGTIQFVPIEGTQGPTAGGTIKNGTYNISRDGGPVPGKYRIEISSFIDVKEATPKELAGALFGRPASDLPAGAQVQTLRKNVVPPKFNETSELKAEVPNAASYEANFSLTK